MPIIATCQTSGSKSEQDQSHAWGERAMEANAILGRRQRRIGYPDIERSGTGPEL
jgi:hypothetical protein